MSLNIPTTKESFEQFLAVFESNLGQTAPILPRAFLRVLAGTESGMATQLFKYLAERAIQTLALTATGSDLDTIGINYGVVRKAAVAAQLRISQPANNGTIIPVTIDYTGDSNGVRYIPLAQAVAAGGVAIVDVQADKVGTAGNLTTGDTLTIGTQVAGITSTTADYVSTLQLGVDKETDENYRRRVLAEIRTVGGGSNGVDYRAWAEASDGVSRAFPFSGAPVGPTFKFKDGDCELVSTIYWSDGNDAIVTKDITSPQSGSQSLKITYNGTNEPYAFQSFLTENREYTIEGYGKGDGTFPVEIRDSGGQVIWTSTASATWQQYSVTFVATGIRLELYSLATAAGSGNFDSMEIFADNSLPGDRVVYIEADSTIDPDGIAPQSLLDSVRTNINIDPVTGQSRPALGTTDEFLFVETIIRNAFDVEVNGLVVEESKETDAKNAVTLGVEDYLESVFPFVEGADSEIDRNDTISALTLGQAVQEILDGFGATAQEVRFKKSGGSFVTLYNVAENELAKRGTLSFG
jgi:hypothetical protein